MLYLRFILTGALLLAQLGFGISQTTTTTGSSLILTGMDDFFTEDNPIFEATPGLFQYLTTFKQDFENAGQKLGMSCSLEDQKTMEEKRNGRIRLFNRVLPSLASGQLGTGALNLVQMGLNRTYGEMRKYPKFCQFHPLIKNNETDLFCGLDRKCCGLSSNSSDGSFQCPSNSLFYNVTSADISDVNTTAKEITTEPSIAISQLPVKLPSPTPALTTSTVSPVGSTSSITETLPTTPKPPVSETGPTARAQPPPTVTLPRRKIQHYVKPTPGTDASGNVSRLSGSITLMLISALTLIFVTSNPLIS